MLLYYGRAIAYEGDQNPVNPHSLLALMSTFAAIPPVMSKRMIFYIVFFAVLVIGFFGFISYSIPGFMKPKLPPISTVKPFAFINQDGGYTTEKDLAGKVAVVNFFFTTCKSVCPKMNNNLKPVYEQYKNNPDFIIVSHTSDPERDSASVLKRYSDSMGVDNKTWIFLTGRKDSLYSAARHSYKIDDPKNFVQDINDDFLHTQFIALINKKGDVVKIYDGIKPSEVKEMEMDISKLLKE
jgi:protein SCO1